MSKEEGDSINDSSSAVSKLIDTAINAGKETAARALGVANYGAVKILLAQHAADKTFINGDIIHKKVVISPHIKCMLDAYEMATGGGVLVLCAPPDSGKTCAAEYMVFGDHKFRPDRSLMISAVAMENFAAEFSTQSLNCKRAEPFLAELLCQALATDPASITGMASQASKIAAMGSCNTSLATPFSTTSMLESYGPNPWSTLEPISAFLRLPVLILDNFNIDTPANTSFAEKLFQAASDSGVFVFILTKNTNWASKLVKLNGGTKIKPLYGNVDNTDYKEFSPFVGVPVWNELTWDVDTLRELIRPDCAENSIDPSDSDLIPDGAVMGPREAMGRLRSKLRKNRR